VAPGPPADVPGQGAALTAPLPRSFYERPALRLARDLLGRLLVRRTPSGLLIGRIVETEAYRPDDPASHSFRGETPRNRTMFGPAGHAYVYVSHGIHHCMNVTAGNAQAVLLRALEPMEGAEEMARLRGIRDQRLLCAGPGRLSQALGITLALDGTDLVRGPDLWIAGGARAPRAVRTPRVGLGANPAAPKPWRFVDPESRFLSRPATWGREPARPRGSR
jgi:DNA-3-methyladenine glycosylase